MEIHVGFVTPEFIRDGRLFPGGLASYTYLTAKTLQGKGVKVTVFMVSDIDRNSEFEGIRVVEVGKWTPSFLRPVKWLFERWIPKSLDRVAGSWSVNRHIARHAERQGIDLLHCTNWKSTGLFRPSIPSLIRISSYEKLWDNNPGNRYIDKTLCVWLEGRCYKRFDTVIGPGGHLASLIRKDLRLGKEVRILPTPVAFDTARSNRAFRPSGKRLVAFAGTVCRIKGASLLFELARTLLDRHDDIVFVVAGKIGTADGVSCSSGLETLVASHPGRFQHHPHLDRHDLSSLYHQTDILVVPSLIDNFPNVALEAASCGALVMASGTSSLETLIEHGENGFIIESRDASTWADWVGRVLDMSRPEVERLKVNMRMRLNRHEADVAVDGLLGVYKTLIGGEAA